MRACRSGSTVDVDCSGTEVVVVLFLLVAPLLLYRESTQLRVSEEPRGPCRVILF